MSTELATVQRQTNAVSVLTPDGFTAAMQLAETLVSSGFLPKAVDKPAKALAIIIAGQELGMPPMKSLRSFHIIEGKPSLSANSMLERFTERGGDVQWLVSDEKTATIKLTPRGKSSHEETFTIADAQKAGLVGKDNWKKYTKAMLRARCASAGLRAIGESEGMYDPDELGAVVTPDGDVYEPPVAAFNTRPLPGKPKNYVEVVDEKTGEVTPIRTTKKRTNLLARAHIIKTNLKISDEIWKGRLNKLFGVESSAVLSEEQLEQLVKALEAAAQKDAEARAGAAKMAEEQTAEPMMTDVQRQLIFATLPGAEMNEAEVMEWHGHKEWSEVTEKEAADMIERLATIATNKTVRG